MNIFDPKVSGSLSVSGSGNISGDLTVLGTIYATISGTTQNAVSASHAAAYTLTSSFHQFTSSFNTGSFTGSFSGDGTGLYGIPATGVTGLNLSRISDGSATASISQANGLIINTNTEITGNLTVTGRLTAQEYHTELVSASIIYESGSSKFGDTLDDTHQITGSVDISGSLKANNVALATDRLINISVSDAGGKYFIDNVRNPILTLIKGYTYKFLFPNIGAHPFRFSTTNDGTHNGGVAYTTGVTIGASPDYIQIEITDSTPSTLYYYCTAHSGMGNSISVLSDILNLDADRNIVYIEPSRIATTGSNTFVGTETVSGSLSVTGSVNITGSITLNGQAIGTGKLDETTFQSYTSSNDSRVSSLESSTGSLNTFTSSIDSTIKNKLNTETVISGSVQVLITGTTGYSTFSSSISTSIGSLSSSVATTTSGLSSSVDSISSSVATTTSGLSSSIGSLSSSVATTTLGLSSSIDALSSSVATTTLGLSSSLSSSIGSLSSSVATTTSGLSSSVGSLSSSVATTTSGLSSSLSSSIGSLSSSVATTTLGLSSSLSSSIESLSSSLSSSIGGLSSSVATTTLNIKNRVDSIETSTGSLNSFTSSINTTIKSKLDSESVISGSIQVLITGTTGYSTFSSSIATTTNDLSSSVATTTSGLTFSISSLSSSAATTTLGLSSSIGSLSSSVATTTLTTKNRVDSIEGKTGSYATTGSNIYQGNQTITGSLYISQDLIVAGSSSIQHISSSIVNIADNIITVNAQNPSVRFGGLAVIDSGSSPQVSGSMLFDSINNQWVFVHQNQTTITSSVLLMGPETYDNLGGEGYLTQNRIPKGTGIEHLNDSNITDTGTKVSINSNTEVTGTLVVTGNVSSPNISAIQTATGSLNSFTSSLLTAIELTGSNLTVKGNLLVKGTTTNVNTTTLDVDNNLINLNGTGASFAGLRVKDTTAPNQISGSFLWDATNDYWIAGQLGSEQRIVRETEFSNAVTRIGNVETSTGSLNSFTSSINTTIKNKLNNDGVISGSSQVNHNSTTNYDANQHIDHTAVSITAGNGLSGGGTIAATRTLSIATGGVTNAMLAGSIANDKLSNSAITIAGTSTSLGGTISAATILSGTGVVSGSAQLTSAFVQKSGDSMTGQLVVASTGTAGAATLKINTSTSTSFIHSQENFSANMTAGQTNILVVGQAGSTKNAGYLGYNWSSSASNNNFISLGHWGADNLLRVYGDGTVYMGTVTTGVWNGTAIGDSYISSATNWNTAYNKRPSSLGFTTSTITLTLGDSTTITASVPTFNQNTTGTAANITASSNTTLTSLSNLATVGTITSGVWNGTAIGNAYLANSSFNVGTTSISLGRASAAQTLTGVSIDGVVTKTIAAGSADNFLYANVGTDDYVRVRGGSDGYNSGWIEIATSDDGTEPIYVRQYNGVFSTVARTATLLDGSGNTSFPGTVTAPTFSGALSGNASTVTNGVYTTGDQTIGGNKTFSGNLLMSAGYISGYVGSTGSGDNFAPFRFSQDYSGWMVNVAGTPGSNNGWGLFWAGNSGAQYGTNGTGGPGNIWSNSTNPNEYVFVGNGSTNMAVHGNTGNVWIAGNLIVAGGTITATTFSGNATTATNSTQLGGYSLDGATSVATRIFNNKGQTHSTYTNFNTVMTPGPNYIQGPTNGPTGTAGGQWYGFMFGLGSDYGTSTGSAGHYASQLYYSRISQESNQYLWARDMESGAWGSWRKLYAGYADSAGNSSTTSQTNFSTLTLNSSTVKSFGNSTYTTSFTNVSSVTVTHSLGSKDVMVMCYDSNDEMFWPSSIVTTSTSVVTITFAANRTGRVVVLR